MQLSVIKTKTKTFYQIKRKNNWSSPSYDRYLFNGQYAIPTFDPSWFVVDGNLEKAEEIIFPTRINHRYELKNPSLVSDKIPLIISKDFSYHDDDEDVEEFLEPYSGLRGMYEKKYDMSEQSSKNIELDLDIIMELEDIENPKNSLRIKFSKQDIDRIIFPSLVLHERPASISSLELYKIIRNHVKSNINLENASITSDYDFCFTVKKKIKLITPYQTQINTNIFGRKAKYKSVDVKFREVEIFEMTHETEKYRSYSVLPSLEAKNDEQLEKKIDTILTDLMSAINDPIDECPNCLGKGFLEIKKFTI